MDGREKEGRRVRALLVKEITQREENQLGEKLPQFLWREGS